MNPGDVEPVPDSKRVCNEYQEPFEGTVRTPRPAAETPTALSGQEPRKSRLVAPFYGIFNIFRVFFSGRDSHSMNNMIQQVRASKRIHFRIRL